MTRWGIGPVWGGTALLYGSAALAAGWVWPGAVRFPPALRGWRVTAGWALLVAGLLLYGAALRALNRGIRNGALVTNGPFAVVRHPIYASWILLALPGGGLLLDSWLMLTTPVAAYVAFKLAIGREDRDLEARFRDAYRSYRQETPELFPRLRRGHGRVATGAPDIRSVLR